MVSDGIISRSLNAPALVQSQRIHSKFWASRGVALHVVEADSKP